MRVGAPRRPRQPSVGLEAFAGSIELVVAQRNKVLASRLPQVRRLRQDKNLRHVTVRLHSSSATAPRLAWLQEMRQPSIRIPV